MTSDLAAAPLASITPLITSPIFSHNRFALKFVLVAGRTIGFEIKKRPGVGAEVSEREASSHGFE